MAYRNIDVDFWQDDYILNLDTDEKLFYLYLLTNGKTTQIGVYPLVMKVIIFETGYSKETINAFMDRLTKDGKITRNIDTKEIYLINWYKYNYINKSPKVMNYLWKEWIEIKSFEFKKSVLENMLKTFSHSKLYIEMEKVVSGDPGFINVLKDTEKRELEEVCKPYKYPIDTVWIGYREQSQSKSQEESVEEEKEYEQSISQSEELENNFDLKEFELNDKYIQDEDDLKRYFYVLLNKWNSLEMGIERPVLEENNKMINNYTDLIKYYDIDYILEVMEQVPTNRWYLGEEADSNGNIFNISFTWFLNIDNFEMVINKVYC